MWLVAPDTAAVVGGGLAVSSGVVTRCLCCCMSKVGRESQSAYKIRLEYLSVGCVCRNAGYAPLEERWVL
jgi:hypothetical protein